MVVSLGPGTLTSVLLFAVALSVKKQGGKREVFVHSNAIQGTDINRFTRFKVTKVDSRWCFHNRLIAATHQPHLLKLSLLLIKVAIVEDL